MKAARARVVPLPWIVALLAMTLGSGCRGPEPAVREGVAGVDAAVVLVVRGSAFEETDARDQVAAVLGELSGRPVRMLEGDPAPDVVLDPIAKRAGRQVIGRYDWREPGCSKKARRVVTAIAGRANIVYDIRLDAKVTSRPATASDRAELGRRDGFGRLRSAVGLDRSDTVVETVLEGSIERTTFAGGQSTLRRKVRSTSRRLDAAGHRAPLELRAIVSEVIGEMPATPAPRWDAVARGLAADGCPFLAWAVGDVLVDDAATRRKLKATTAGVMQTARSTTKHIEDPTPASDAVAASGTTEVGGIAVMPEPSKTTSGPDPRQSCSTLCSLHMVEICNNDRTLWSQNGARWESTRCGTRRSEQFLEDCYRMQWLSGTYEHACLQPCEAASDGRARLSTLLRHAGCLPTGG
jgi:hypothetical protein